jgi:IclR family transcriptional regulator, pca regulon regulatory protein
MNKDLEAEIEKPRSFVQSLAKGLSLMKVIAQAGRPLTLTEIAQKVGTNPVTASRFCYTLIKTGYLQRKHGKFYHLTPQVLALSASIIHSTDWLEITSYFLRELFLKLNETVSASILVDADVIYMIRIIKKKIIDFDIRVGTRVPVYCSAMGKVLMAFSPPSKINDALQKIEFNKFTRNTIVTLKSFLREIEKTRKLGYAINDEEFALGNRAISAPLIDEKGYAFAAIVMATPSEEYSLSRLKKEVVPNVLNCAQKINSAIAQMSFSSQI